MKITFFRAPRASRVREWRRCSRRGLIIDLPVEVSLSLAKHTEHLYMFLFKFKINVMGVFTLGRFDSIKTNSGELKVLQSKGVVTGIFYDFNVFLEVFGQEKFI